MTRGRCDLPLVWTAPQGRRATRGREYGPSWWGVLMGIFGMFGVEDETVEAMRGEPWTFRRTTRTGFMSDVTKDKMAAKATASFWNLLSKIPEDANGVFGKRFEVRATQLGGEGLSQIDQKQVVVKTTKSPHEALRLADETDGHVWDRKNAQVVYTAGDSDPRVRKRKREQRDGWAWGWNGGGNKTEQISGGRGGERPSIRSRVWNWTPGQGSYPGEEEPDE